mgnify:CR=1 FL=1
MRILIAGVGEVGSNMAWEILHNGQSLVLVDQKEENLKPFSGVDNVELHHGNISTSPYLREQDQKAFDMYFATTESDEVNMITCSMAKRVKVPITICRLQKMLHGTQSHQGLKQILGIDHLVNPIQILVDRLMEIYSAPNLFNHIIMFDEQVNLYGFLTRNFCSIIGKSISDVNEESRNLGFEISFLIKGKTNLIVDRDIKVEIGDYVYFFAREGKLETIRDYLGYLNKRNNRVVIVGGGRIGTMLAMELENKGIYPIIIEKRPEQCEKLASILRKSTILNMDGTDQKAMLSERINTSNFFLALSNDDSANIIACHLASDMGIENTVCLVQEADMAKILHNSNGVLISISPRLTMKNYIMKLFAHNFMLARQNLFGISNFQILESQSLSMPHVKNASYDELKAQSIHPIIQRDGDNIYPVSGENYDSSKESLFVCDKNLRIP